MRRGAPSGSRRAAHVSVPTTGPGDAAYAHRTPVSVSNAASRRAGSGHLGLSSCVGSVRRNPLKAPVRPTGAPSCHEVQPGEPRRFAFPANPVCTAGRAPASRDIAHANGGESHRSRRLPVIEPARRPIPPAGRLQPLAVCNGHSIAFSRDRADAAPTAPASASSGRSSDVPPNFALLHTRRHRVRRRLVLFPELWQRGHVSLRWATVTVARRSRRSPAWRRRRRGRRFQQAQRPATDSTWR